MNSNHLIAQFDHLIDTPQAISRLRHFVLELAVRGKLVDQNLTDEPVLRLLDKIQEEKDRRVTDGQAKRSKALPEVQQKETPFDIPKSWRWVRLGTITQVVMGQSPPGETYNKEREGIPLINGPVEFTEGPFGKTVVNQYTTAPTNLCEEGDLLICVRGSTTGRTNIAAFRACIGRGVAAIRPFFADGYVRLFIWRQRASIIAMGRGIAFPSVSRQQIEELPVPLPPLAEQHRIVANVEEVMALCDKLEAKTTALQKQKLSLLEAVFHEALTTPPTA
jgi:type I restriction enzyme, S subunit